MFARRWFYTRIRAAEQALDAARVDEAFACALDPDVRADRRGQQLADKIARMLMARARLAAQSGNYGAAIIDLDRVDALGRGSEEVVALRQRWQATNADRQRDAAAARAAVDDAEKKVQGGRLESGRLAVDRVPDAERRAMLERELDVRVERSAQLIQEAEQALVRDDVFTAARCWSEANTRHGRTREADALAARLSVRLRDLIREWLRDGRLDRLLSARVTVDLLLPRDPELEGCSWVISLCSKAAERLAANDYVGMRHALLRLRAGNEGAKWLENALEALSAIAQQHDRLIDSPLGLITHSIRSAEQTQVASIPPALSPARAQGGGMNAHSILLLVDGGNSSLLIGRDRVRLGRAGSDARVEVPIPADVHSLHAEIVREGDDYFLIAHGPAMVNRLDVKRTLLRDGDRIVLGGAGKMTFQLPSAKSGSAVLRMSHRCRLPMDVSEVVLFRETCLIGPQPSCHIRLREGENQVVLFERAGRLMARQAPNGRRGVVGDAHELLLGKTTDFGDVRITAKYYEHG